LGRHTTSQKGSFSVK